MAAIPVTLNGTFTTDTGSTVGVFQGTMAYSGLGVGGGPIIPPDKPPGIWGGPIDPHPDHGLPGAPGTWPPQNPPHPAHPIVLPPDGGGAPPIDPPTEPPSNPPSENWVWGYVPAMSAWQPVYVPAEGEATPKA